MLSYLVLLYPGLLKCFSQHSFWIAIRHINQPLQCPKNACKLDFWWTRIFWQDFCINHTCTHTHAETTCLERKIFLDLICFWCRLWPACWCGLCGGTHTWQYARSHSKRQLKFKSLLGEIKLYQGERHIEFPLPLSFSPPIAFSGTLLAL